MPHLASWACPSDVGHDVSLRAATAGPSGACTRRRAQTRSGPCRGRRPWLGGGFASESCDQLNKLLVRTGSNTYFPKRMTVISLLNGNDAVKESVEHCWPSLENVVRWPT